MSEPEDGIRPGEDKLTDRASARPSGAWQPLTPPAGLPAVDAGSSPDGRVAAVTVVCFLAVALTSPLNLTLLFVSYDLVEVCLGGRAADGSQGCLIVLAVVLQTALFAALWLPVWLLTRKRSWPVRAGAVVALTVAYLGAWLGWTLWLAAEMTRTNSWP